MRMSFALQSNAKRVSCCREYTENVNWAWGRGEVKCQFVKCFGHVKRKSVLLFAFTQKSPYKKKVIRRNKGNWWCAFESRQQILTVYAFLTLIWHNLLKRAEGQVTHSHKWSKQQIHFFGINLLFIRVLFQSTDKWSRDECKFKFTIYQLSLVIRIWIVCPLEVPVFFRWFGWLATFSIFDQ